MHPAYWCFKKAAPLCRYINILLLSKLAFSCLCGSSSNRPQPCSFRLLLRLPASPLKIEIEHTFHSSLYLARNLAFWRPAGKRNSRNCFFSLNENSAFFRERCFDVLSFFSASVEMFKNMQVFLCCAFPHPLHLHQNIPYWSTPCGIGLNFWETLIMVCVNHWKCKGCPAEVLVVD